MKFIRPITAQSVARKITGPLTAKGLVDDLLKGFAKPAPRPQPRQEQGHPWGRRPNARKDGKA